MYCFTFFRNVRINMLKPVDKIYSQTLDKMCFSFYLRYSSVDLLDCPESTLAQTM